MSVATYRFKCFWLTVLGSAGLIVCAISIGDTVWAEMAVHKLASSKLSVREKGLRYIAEEREQRGASAVYQLLEQESDRDLLEKAGYTAMRLRNVRAVPVLRRRADSSPDDLTRAKLVMYAARASHRDARLIDWLNAGLASGEPWLRAGSALGLLELGQIEGGSRLIEMALELDPAVAVWAFNDFRSFVDPMAQIVGYNIEDWKVDTPPDQRLLDKIRTFWEQYVSSPLLVDMLTRRERLDRQWTQLNRLLHAQERVAKWLGSGS